MESARRQLKTHLRARPGARATADALVGKKFQKNILRIFNIFPKRTITAHTPASILKSEKL